MKLTIKDKVPLKEHPSSSQNIIASLWRFSPMNKIYQSLCRDPSYNKTKIVIRVNNERERVLLDAIRIDMNGCLGKMYQQYVGEGKDKKQLALQHEQIYEFIYEMTQKMKCQYSLGLGFLCTHLYCHMRNPAQRQKIVFQFMRRFFPFLKNQSQDSHNPQKQALSQETQHRILKYLTNNQQTINRININDMDLNRLSSQYQKTLLLEYIPPQYSEYIIFAYLQEGVEQYIRLVVSLIHYTINTKNTINELHLMNVLLNAYMGVIQWPIVIANRHHFMMENR